MKRMLKSLNIEGIIITLSRHHSNKIVESYIRYPISTTFFVKHLNPTAIDLA